MNFELSTKEAAELLNISDRRVRQLIEDGLFERLENDKLDARKIVEQYYSFKFDVGKVKSYDLERAEHEVIKRKLSELKLSRQTKELLVAKEVETEYTNMVVTFRNKLLSLPSKIAPTVVNNSNVNEIMTLIDSEIRDCLIELSEYNPDVFKSGDDAIDDS